MKKKFEYNLEALRGLAALIVVLTHCFGFSKVLDGIDRKGILLYDLPGHLAVLIFFILSGYVIGLSTKEKLHWSTAWGYIKKRMLRLYPIYILCIFIAIFITSNKYSLYNIFFNLLFMQNIFTTSLYEVGVIWSLNYEFIFYILFIPISIYSIKPSYACFLSLILGLFFQYIIVNQQVAMYGFGFCFWLIGLWLSNNKMVYSFNYSKYSLYSIFFIILSFVSLNFTQDILRYKLNSDSINGVYVYNPTAIMLSDFTYLPLGIISILYFSNKSVWFEKYLIIYSMINPFLFILLMFYKEDLFNFNNMNFFISCFLYFISIVLLILGIYDKKESTNILHKYFIKIGGISYGIYMIHFIFIILVGRFINLQYGYLSFVFKVAIVFILTFVGSYILEKIFQPLIVKLIRK